MCVTVITVDLLRCCSYVRLMREISKKITSEILQQIEVGINIFIPILKRITQNITASRLYPGWGRWGRAPPADKRTKLSRCKDDKRNTRWPLKSSSFLF